MIKSYLHIKSSGKRGRGIFTKQSIPAGTIIEIAPVVVLPVKEVKDILKTKMSNYVFRWGESARKLGVALGYASIYNHSYNSNCQYFADFKKNILTIKTVRPIKKGDELMVNYNSDFDDKTPVWFDVK